MTNSHDKQDSLTMGEEWVCCQVTVDRTPLMGLEDASAIPAMRATSVSAYTEMVILD
jgi:hypothetical protein